MRVVLAGTSGVGKSSLLAVLSQRGFPTFKEPQRAILEQQLAVDGPNLPAKNPKGFLDALRERGMEDWRGGAQHSHPVIYDRGLPDLIAYAKRFEVLQAPYVDAAQAHRYDHVFVLEPWPEIFEVDAFRGLSFEAYAEFHRLIVQAYERLGYALTTLPRDSVEGRADEVVDQLMRRGPPALS